MAGALALAAFGAHAETKSVVVGYQTDAQPSSVAIANGEFDKATGFKIDFRRFNSGAEIFAAIASGDVQIGYVGSSPFAAATSRGLDVKAFYLASISGIDEALVVRNGSGINSLADLKGKKLAAAPVSTDHYQLLALIKSLGLTEKDVQVFAIPQPDIVAGYNRGDLDGGFVWDPALTELKKNGKVLVTSKDVAEQGRADLLGLGRDGQAFAKDQPGLPQGLLRRDRQISDLVRQRARRTGVPTAKTPRRSRNCSAARRPIRRPRSRTSTSCRVKAQASDAWLGGGEKSGLAKILKPTPPRSSRTQKKISEVLPSYAAFVTPDVAARGEEGRRL